MTDAQQFYQEQVWPQIPDAIKSQLTAKYPLVRLQAEDGFVPLESLPVTMLIGLTGTGKSTTLKALAALRESGTATYDDDIPSRRELADWVLIPAAQVSAGEAIQPVKERTERFRLTRHFAEHIDAGGSAAVYGWLHYRGTGPLLSEALRGPREIQYALDHYPNWRLVELWVDPVIRLRRLSQRQDSLDQVAVKDAPINLDFLNIAQVMDVEAWMAAGEISTEAVVTCATEAQSYGSQPYDADNTTSSYCCIIIDELTPEAIAQQIAEFMETQA